MKKKDPPCPAPKPPSPSPTSPTQPEKPQTESSPSNRSQFAAETLVNLGTAPVELPNDLRDDDESPMAAEEDTPMGDAGEDVGPSNVQHADVRENHQHPLSVEEDNVYNEEEKATDGLNAEENQNPDQTKVAVNEPADEHIIVEDWVDSERTRSDPMNVDEDVVSTSAAHNLYN